MVFSLYELGWRDLAKVWAIWVWRNLVFWEECEVWVEVGCWRLGDSIDGRLRLGGKCEWLESALRGDINGSVNWPVRQVLVT